VPLTVAGHDASGQPLQEQTATLSINCHGCRYFSKHQVEKNAWLTLEIPGAEASQASYRFRARVAWVQKSRRLRGLFQVGVEFEAPGNVWGIASPPADWQNFGAPGVFDAAVFEEELKRLLALATAGTRYQLLGVSSIAPRAQIKRCFYELARKFHPDRHMARPEWAPLLHRLMDALTLAYKTLAEETSRRSYDRRLAESGVFTLGQNKSETKKNAEECLEKAKECLRAQNYVGSILWLRKAVRMEPDSSKYHALLARSLAAVPQYRREAVGHFEKALELELLNAWAHFQFGRLYEELSLPWRARPHYVKVVELDPQHAQARTRLRAIGSAEGKAGKADSKFLDRILHRLSK
jgi:curved DNA-binding protein CbpA